MALALLAAGCGDDQGAESPLDEALGYLPADAPFAVAIETDLESGQYEAVSSILDRFPFGGQVKEGLKTEIEEGGDGDIDFDADVRPLLGNELVVGAPDTDALAEDAESFVAALQVADADKARELLDADPELEPAGEASGATIWEEESGTAVALEEDVLVTDDSRGGLEQALVQRDSPGRMTEATFEEPLGDLPEDALLRVYADMEQIVGAGPGADRARSVEWVAALRKLGATGSANGEGLYIDVSLATDPAGLTDEDLPIASSPENATVVGREEQVAVGIRDASQIERFLENVAGVADSGRLGELDTVKKQFGRRLKVDIDRDLVDQLAGEASISAGLDGSYGFRVELDDPRAAKRTLDRLAERAPDIGKTFDLDAPAVVRPRRGEDFYALATADGERAVFGVVDDVFVLAQDPAQAGELAAADPGTVPGAAGSVVLQADAEALATEIASQRLDGIEGLGAGLFTGPLGQLTGSLEAETDGLRGHMQLEIE